MKITTSFLISIVSLILGIILSKSLLWIPITVLIASIIEAPTRNWVRSDRLGAYVNLSMLIKAIFALIGLYSLIGQLVCIGLIVYWFI